MTTIRVLFFGPGAPRPLPPGYLALGGSADGGEVVVVRADRARELAEAGIEVTSGEDRRGCIESGGVLMPVLMVAAWLAALGAVWYHAHQRAEECAKLGGVYERGICFDPSAVRRLP